MNEQQFEECSLEEATHVEVNGKVHEIGGKLITTECYHGEYMGLRWLEEDAFIPIDMFSILGIKTFKEIKQEPIVFEAVVRRSAGMTFLYLGSVPEGIPLGTRFKCVQIVKED